MQENQQRLSLAATFAEFVARFDEVLTHNHEAIVPSRMECRDKPLDTHQAAECKAVNTPSARNPKASYTVSNEELRISRGSI
jgi:hypothetical protein